MNLNKKILEEVKKINANEEYKHLIIQLIEIELSPSYTKKNKYDKLVEKYLLEKVEDR